MVVNPLHFYPTNVLYGKSHFHPPIEYDCTSFFGINAKGKCDLYRLIVRVHDKAYQIIKTSVYFPEELYYDFECSQRANITIPDSGWLAGPHPFKPKKKEVEGKD